MNGFDPRRAALALLLAAGAAGCGSAPPLGRARAALVVGCNSTSDCQTAYGNRLGAGQRVDCDPVAHLCQVNNGLDCSVPADCDDDDPCTDDACVMLVMGGLGSCAHTQNSSSGNCCNVGAATSCPGTVNSCQTKVCSSGYECGIVSNGGSGCCNVNSDCGGGASCDGASNRCACAAGQKFCPGLTHAQDVCTSGCCSDADCPAIANGVNGCDTTTHSCVPRSCDSGFHACGDVCASSSSPASCGTSCSSCPMGNACQQPVCNPSGCGFVTGAGSNCCTIADNCPPPADSCHGRACVASQCQVTTLCSLDMSAPADLATPADLAPPPADLATVADLATAADLAAPVAGDLSASAPAPAPAPVLSLGGGAGCAVAAAAPASPWAALALVLLAIFFVRRRAS